MNFTKYTVEGDPFEINVTILVILGLTPPN